MEPVRFPAGSAARHALAVRGRRSRVGPRRHGRATQSTARPTRPRPAHVHWWEPLVSAAESLSLPVEITMLDDWHVGTGAGGAGAVAREVRRDAYGLPYVPASTLRGI